MNRILLLTALLVVGGHPLLCADAYMAPPVPADSTAQRLADIRAAERRRIPIEVQLKTAGRYKKGRPIIVTIIVTNLFEPPLVMNSRMLVNHPRLPGEVSFHISDPDGKRVDIRRLITPLSLRDQDFVRLSRGESMMREIDLADLYEIERKGLYKVRVSYHNDVDQVRDSIHAWKGQVVSDPIDLVVK